MVGAVPMGLHVPRGPAPQCPLKTGRFSFNPYSQEPKALGPAAERPPSGHPPPPSRAWRPGRVQWASHQQSWAKSAPEPEFSEKMPLRLQIYCKRRSVCLCSLSPATLM